jgi:hypothetical protein
MNVRGWENSTAPNYNTADTSLVAGSCQEAAADIRTATTSIFRSTAKAAGKP